MYTGMLSLAYMSIAVLLAARFSWVESLIHGLDKGYALHKKLGISATVTLFFHWLMVKSAHWLIEAQLITLPEHGPRPDHTGVNWHSIAEQVGDVAFKIFIIFSVISLVQAISYKRFKFTHKLGGVLMLAGVFHTVFLIDWEIFSAPMNIAIILLSVTGVICALLSLSGRIGKNRKVKGQVREVTRFDPEPKASSVIRFSVQLEAKLEDYKEGQFAYLDFHDNEAPHPFSILNYDDESLLITFGIKGLGDYTEYLVTNLKAGQTVTVEGGYGRFQIPSIQNQVWIGAGIGIVPFISRLYWLKHKANKEQVSFEKIDLYYCVNSKKEAYFEQEIIQLLEKLTFIELHLFDAEKGELLIAEQIAEKMDSKHYEVSFCGPVPFRASLQNGFKLAGFSDISFHSEVFKMR